MGSDVIKSLKSSLADLTYVLFIIGKEIGLIIENSDDENVNNELRRTILALQDSNSNVIKLYHEISTNEVGIQNEWYDDETKIKSLQHEIDNLKSSINCILEANKNFLNISK